MCKWCSLIYWGRAIYIIEVFIGFLFLAAFAGGFTTSAGVDPSAVTGPATDPVTGPVILSLASLFFVLKYAIFFQLGYLAVYILNDIIDFESDKKDQSAAFRKPLVQQKVGLKQALYTALGLLTLGSIGTFWVAGMQGLLIYHAAIYLNLLYSVVFKKLGRAVRIVFNAFLHGYRFLIPFLLFGKIGLILTNWQVFIFYLLLPIYMLAYRRSLDKSLDLLLEAGRPGEVGSNAKSLEVGSDARDLGARDLGANSWHKISAWVHELMPLWFKYLTKTAAVLLYVYVVLVFLKYGALGWCLGCAKAASVRLIARVVH